MVIAYLDNKTVCFILTYSILFQKIRYSCATVVQGGYSPSDMKVCKHDLIYYDESQIETITN